MQGPGCINLIDGIHSMGQARANIYPEFFSFVRYFRQLLYRHMLMEEGLPVTEATLKALSPQIVDTETG